MRIIQTRLSHLTIIIPDIKQSLKIIIANLKLYITKIFLIYYSCSYIAINKA